VVVADDHPSVRENLRYLIDAEPDLRCVGVTKDGRQALALCSELLPDVVVLDHDMPGLDGLTVAKILDRMKPRIRVIMYTLDAQICSAAQSYGAVACITKDAPYETLLRAIRQGSAAKSSAA
jgi:DNA-binding NarL/FixJ family response regulator